jgi:hypothetical protein
VKLKKYLTSGDGAKMKKIEASMSKVGCKDGSETWVSNKNIDAFLQSVDGSSAKRDVGDYEIEVRRSISSPPPAPPQTQPQQVAGGGALESKLDSLAAQVAQMSGAAGGSALGSKLDSLVAQIARTSSGGVAAAGGVGRVHSEGIILECYLEKKGGGTTMFIGNTSFKQRYFCLFNSGQLTYHDKPGGPPKGTIALQGAFVTKLPGEGEFDIGNANQVFRTFHLRAPTNSAREMWFICLESAGCEVRE